MGSALPMTRNAKLYVAVLLALAVLVLAASLSSWEPSNPARFACLLALALVASVLRVSMPRMAGEISFSLMFVMIGIVDLPLPETLLIGCATLVVESVWHPGTRLVPLQVFFALANVAIAIACAKDVYESNWLLAQGVDLPVRIVVAALVCFAVNTFAVAAFVSLSERQSLLAIWQKRSFGRLPQYLLGAAVAWAYLLVKNQIGWPAGLLILPVLYLLQRTYSLYVGRLEDSILHAEEMNALHMRTIEALAGAIEARDDCTAGHLQRVKVYAGEMGREFGLSPEELNALRAAAVLHDIGKLAVPEHIISKPGRLTPEEFNRMKVHPLVGAEILERVRFPYEVVPIVRSHHEKWDGTGYPEGLRGEEIPIGARIISAVDALDALASDRQYRRALPIGEAMARIAQESGKSFDPRVVEMLRRHYLEWERKAHSEAAQVAKLSLGPVECGGAPAAGYAADRRFAMPEGLGPPESTLEAIASARGELQSAFGAVGADGRPVSLRESLGIAAQRLGRVVPWDAVACYILSDQVLRPEYVNGDNYRLFSSLEIPLGQGLSGWVAENKLSIVNGNPTVESGYLNDPKVYSTLRSALAVPLATPRGVLGVLTLYRDARDAFSQEDLLIVESVGPAIAEAVESGMARPRFVGESEIDPALAMPRARAFVRHLEGEIARTRRLSTPLALFICRAPGWAEWQQAGGSAEAARRISSLASAVRNQCRDFDYVARTGPAEFMCTAPGLTRSAAQARLARLLDIVTSGRDCDMRLAAGCACYPDDASTPQELIAAAERDLLSGQTETAPAACA